MGVRFGNGVVGVRFDGVGGGVRWWCEVVVWGGGVGGGVRWWCGVVVWGGG